MDVWIDEAGEVKCVKVTRSIPIADTAAVAAVRQWKFTPAKLGDRPVAVVHEVGIFYPDGR
jgi:TonB family protein